MNVLVTGGAGFIGSHLVESRLALGDKVTVLDNFSTGAWHDDRTQLVYGSVVDSIELPRLVKQADLVFHLAAAVGARLVTQQPLESLRTNVLGTDQMLQLCAQYRKRILFASSSEVYGRQSGTGDEEDDVVYGSSSRARWGYAASKLIDEFLAHAHAHANGLEFVGLRLFNTSGPRQTGKYGMVLPNFAYQASHGMPLTVHGYGTQTRTFTHVKDVVTAFNKLAICEAALGEIVNVGGREEISILDLAYRVRERAGSESTIVFTPHVELMQRRSPSTYKLRRLIGWVPDTPLDTIIDDVIEDQRRTA